MASKDIRLSESMEDYLEIILDLERIKKVARTKDIAEKMGVQRGTVTGALKSLNKKGLINYEPYSFITLTRKGEKIAKEITRRHSLIKDFLFRVLQIDIKRADINACRMEHAMDKESIDKLLKFISFIDNCPRTGTDWISSFMHYCSLEESDWKKCEGCIDKCITTYHAKTY